MSQIWQVMVFEYGRHVFRKRFLFALLSLPAFILVMAFVVFLLVRSEFNTMPVGYVDHSGLLTGPGAVDNEGSWVNLKRFVDEEEAQDIREHHAKWHVDTGGQYSKRLDEIYLPIDQLPDEDVAGDPWT